MSFWEKNTKILQEKYTGLLEAIIRGDAHDEEDMRVETAASGEPTLLINGLYVHSPRDPVREAQRLAGASLVDETGTKDISRRDAKTQSSESESSTSLRPEPVVLLGFGLGYVAEAVAELAPRRFIIIVERNLGLLRKALELRDLSRLLSGIGVAFTPGENSEGVVTALALFEKSAGKKCDPIIIRNRTLTGIDEQWYASLEGRIRAWVMRDDVNRATLKKFGRRWVRNLSRNMDAIRDIPGVSRLAGLVADASTPIFLAAAGPGLDSILPLLPEIRRRCIIVAVDTSLRFLLRGGVAPDFVLVVDPQFWNSRHLNRCAGPRTRLIIESAVYPPVLRLPFKGFYLCGSLFPLGNFIEKRVDPKGSLGAGGSVATSAWDFARVLGAQQIWIAGLDLAFPGLRTHFKGAQFEEKALAESTRLNPAETWLVHALRDGIPFNAPALGGGQVLTDRRLSLYAAWFEENFRRFPHVRNYSLTSQTCSGGLAIAGLEPLGAEAFLALPERREEIDRRLEAAFSRIEAEFFDPEETRQRSLRYKNAVTTLASGLEQIRNACLRGTKIAEQALQQDRDPADSDKTLAALGEINRFITGSDVKEIAGFLFPPETVAEMNKAGQLADRRAVWRNYLETSLRLYQSLADAVLDSLPVL